MRGKEGNGSRKRGIYRGGVLGGGGEGIRDPEKIRIPAAAARLGVGRKKTAGPTRQWLRARARGSGRPARRVFASGARCWGVGLAHSVARGEAER